jgi:hypothetical protein
VLADFSHRPSLECEDSSAHAALPLPLLETLKMLLQIASIWVSRTCSHLRDQAQLHGIAVRSRTKMCSPHPGRWRGSMAVRCRRLSTTCPAIADAVFQFQKDASLYSRVKWLNQVQTLRQTWLISYIEIENTMHKEELSQKYQSNQGMEKQPFRCCPRRHSPDVMALPWAWCWNAFQTQLRQQIKIVGQSACSLSNLVDGILAVTWR